MYRKCFGILSSILALAVMFSAVAPVYAQSGGRGNGLSKHDRELLADAVANGKETVTLLIASQPGKNNVVARNVEALGGNIRYREDSLDYLRVEVPTGQVDAFVKISGIRVVSLDEIIPLDDPAPEAVDDSVLIDPPGPTTPNENAYMPTRDTGAAQFVAANPNWDGRGVVVGILDTGVTLDHPSLQTTTTGERKIIEWVTYTDPFTDGDPTWVNMENLVTASGGIFTNDAVNYTAPADGEYRFGIFFEGDPRLGGEVGSNVNRDGDSTDSFGVLWETNTDTVYVDTNQNNDFSDDMAMRNYSVNYDVNYFGTDDLATAQVDRLPFVVQTDGQNKVVNIGIVSGAHGSHVAGITAGNDLFGGTADGAAPGAQIVSIRVCLFITGCTSHAMIEGMIFAAQNANVDVINMSIGGLPSLNDGNNTRAVLYNRLIEQYKVQMFISAGNSYAGINTVGDPSVASNVVSVGAYVHQDTWWYNYGAISAKVDGIFPFSSRGPREDGGFKPNIVAPGSAVSTIPMWQTQAGQCLNYTCAVGYAMFNGTSMAAPQSTGAAALLISAAKQSGVQYKPAQLRQAIYSSARYLPAYGAYEQGNGLLQVGAAWDLLKTNIKTVDITSKAPVNTVLASFLATTGFGTGIYEREGWSAGQSAQRTVTFTRTSGGSKAIQYNLIWVGNDGTFSSANSISLGLNKPANLTVNITAATSGEHSALLYLDDPSTVGYDYQMMNTIVAAERFTAASNYTITRSGSADRPDTTSLYFYVPAGTPAFKLDITVTAGRMRGLRYHPYGVSIDSTSTAFNNAGTTVSRAVANPQPGVWELMMETSRSSTADPATFTVTASILGASVTPNPDVSASAAIGVPVARSYTLTNLFGAFTGRAVGTAFGSAKLATPTIANLGQNITYVTVAAGSTSLRATIGSPSDPAADLDLFVFNCTTGSCVSAGQSADGDSEESVTINNPAAGVWAVLVDGYSVPAGTTTYNYVDVFANAVFGTVSVTDANALRNAGSSWVVPGAVTANTAPSAGRVLLGNVQVRTDTGIVVGSGDVIVQSVTP